MTEPAITFDFHNTIASADMWFHIEVHDLMGAYLRWRADRDGVAPDQALVDEANASYRQLRQAIHHHGHEPTAEQSIDLVLHQLGFDESQVMIDEGTEAIMRGALSDIAPIPGVVDSIETIASEGIPLGIVSIAIYHPFLLWVLDDFGIAEHFSSVTTSARAGFYKNRPEIFWRALEDVSGDPERSLHVGDSFRMDVVGSRRAGMQTAWYQREGASPLPEVAAPDLTFTTLEGAAPQLLERVATVRK